ncbi:hypothetical protein C8R47DRAFT_1070280 [Mycena vitilis]|nr:hypothetical protein C8R47DRAFT_1070280 [Mycena vitilis]
MSRTSAAVPSTEENPTQRRVRKTEGKKPGKNPWIHGTKLVFFASRAEEWKIAQAAGVVMVGKFYDDVVNLYHQKYGYDMQDDEDLQVDLPDPTDPNAGDPDARSIDKEEAARRTTISNLVRTRVGAWYRGQYGGASGEKGKANMFKELLHGRLDAGEGKPIKGQAWQFYSKHYYVERVKGRSDFNVLWAQAAERAVQEGKVPADVKLRGEVTRQIWGEETPEFQAQVVAQLEKEYQQTVRAWEIGRAEEPSRSKEELSAALNNAGFYLQPLAESIHERFGMSVCIMLCGPVGDRGGAVEVRSVHAGRTRGLNPRKWYEFDRMGYREAEKSMIRFAEKCYTDEDRRSRAVGPTASGSGTTASGTTASGTTASGSGTTTGEGSSTTPGGGSSQWTSLPPPPSIPQTGGGPSSTQFTFPPPPITNPTPPPPSSAPLPSSAPPPSSADNTAGPRPPSPHDPLRDETNDRMDVTPPPASPSPSPSTPAENGERDIQRDMDLEEEGSTEPVPDAWRRTDMAKWPAELRKAHAAFALGVSWGDDWAGLVSTYIDFEAACGYQESGPRIHGEGKPDEIVTWLKGGRKWFAPPHIARVGRVGEAGSYADNWWLWWRSIQPPERLWIGGMLTSPVEMTWGKLARLYGRNGFMQIVASLLWWGMQEFRSGENGEKSGWSLAVSDVDDILRGMLKANILKPPAVETGKKRNRVDSTDEGREDGGGKKPRAKRGEASAATRSTRSAGSAAREGVQKGTKVFGEDLTCGDNTLHRSRDLLFG